MVKNKPIILNELGEAMVPIIGRIRPAFGQDFDCGEHLICGGIIKAKQISNNYYVLICNDCGLRIHIPNTVLIKEELRKFFEEKIARRNAIIAEIDKIGPLVP